MWKPVTIESLKNPHRQSNRAVKYLTLLMERVRFFGGERMEIDEHRNSVRIFGTHLIYCRVYVAMWDIFLNMGIGWNKVWIRYMKKKVGRPKVACGKLPNVAITIHLDEPHLNRMDAEFENKIEYLD